MFKRHAAQVTFVKTPKQTSTNPSVPSDGALELIKKITKKDVVRATVGAVGVYASVVTVNTLSTIAINYAPKN